MPLLSRCLVLGPGDRGVLGGAVGPDQGDAELVRPLGHGVGNGRTAQADEVHELDVLGPAVRVVEQAGEEVGRPAAGRDLLLEHGGQHGRWVPPVDHEDGLAGDERTQQAAEHPDRVTHGSADESRPVAVRLHWRTSWRTSQPKVRWRVHDTLGVGRGPRGVADQRRRVGVDVYRSVNRIGRAQVVEAVVVRVVGLPHHDHVLEIARGRRGSSPAPPGSRAG